MSKIKNGGLDQYGAGPFEQQQFATAGVEGVNLSFDDDCGGYLALLFPSGDGTAGAISGDSGPSATKDPDAVSERSWLDVGGTSTYDGRTTTPGSSDACRGESVPGPTRDTRPLIGDGDGQESALRIVGEVLLPFLLAGFGSVFAGLILDLVQVRISLLIVAKL